MATASRKAGRPLLLLSPSWSLAGAFVLVIRLGHRRGGKLPDRSCQRAIAPNTFLREVPLRVSVRGLCPVVADTDLSGANSSPQGPLHPAGRAAGLEINLTMIQATTSKVTFE